MSRRSLRLACAAAAAALAATALLPQAAGAHGLVGRADLPIPTWLFGWAAAIVLGVSFAALGALWREPRLEEPSERRVGRIPRVLDIVCGALGIAFFALVVYAGFAGSDVPTANIAPDVELAVAPGIYAVTLSVDGGPPLPAVASLGTNPTFVDRGALVLEVHVLDWRGDLYDRRVRTAFVARLRDEQKFDSVEALLVQIDRDIAQARTALAAAL